MGNGSTALRRPQSRTVVTANGIVSFGYAVFLSVSLVRLAGSIEKTLFARS